MHVSLPAKPIFPTLPSRSWLTAMRAMKHPDKMQVKPMDTHNTHQKSIGHDRHQKYTNMRTTRRRYM